MVMLGPAPCFPNKSSTAAEVVFSLSKSSFLVALATVVAIGPAPAGASSLKVVVVISNTEEAGLQLSH